MKQHTQLTRPFSPAEEVEEAEMQAGRGVGSAPRGSGAEGGWPAGPAGRAARSGCLLPPPWLPPPRTHGSLPCGFSLKPLQSACPSRCHSAMRAVAPQQWVSPGPDPRLTRGEAPVRQH